MCYELCSALMSSSSLPMCFPPNQSHKLVISLKSGNVALFKPLLWRKLKTETAPSDSLRNHNHRWIPASSLKKLPPPFNFHVHPSRVAMVTRKLPLARSIMLRIYWYIYDILTVTIFLILLCLPMTFHYF